VRVIFPEAVADAVYVTKSGVAPELLLFENVPPAPPSLHLADVAGALKAPPSGSVVPPWQIAGTAPPATTHCANTFPAEKDIRIMNKNVNFFILVFFRLNPAFNDPD
jgi:hypothetical protein